MANQEMTLHQYNLLMRYNSIVGEMIGELEKTSTFEDLMSDWSVSPIDSIDIVEQITYYQMHQLNDTAVIGISNTSSVVIISAESDYVFGYMQIGAVKHFFLSEIVYKIDEDDEDSDSVPMFKIGEDGIELSLSNAMRINR